MPSVVAWHCDCHQRTIEALVQLAPGAAVAWCTLHLGNDGRPVAASCECDIERCAHVLAALDSLTAGSRW